MKKSSTLSQDNVIADVSVDCVMIGFHADELKVLLLKWGETGWSLPRGGIYRSEQIADAASRVLKETTGIPDVFLQQFHTFGAANRTATGSIISIGFYALVDFETVTPNLTGSYQWCKISEIPEMLFDHNDMI